MQTIPNIVRHGFFLMALTLFSADPAFACDCDEPVPVFKTVGLILVALVAVSVVIYAFWPLIIGIRKICFPQDEALTAQRVAILLFCIFVMASVAMLFHAAAPNYVFAC